jgi:hypothetical protein
MYMYIHNWPKSCSWHSTHGRVWLIGTRVQPDSLARLVRVRAPSEVVFFFWPAYPISTNYSAYRTFPAGSWRVTRMHSGGQKGYFWLPGTKKCCESFSIKFCKNIASPWFHEAIIHEHTGTEIVGPRYYIISRHRCPKRWRVAWVVTVWKIWCYFKPLSKSFILRHHSKLSFIRVKNLKFNSNLTVNSYDTNTNLEVLYCIIDNILHTSGAEKA